MDPTLLVQHWSDNNFSLFECFYNINVAIKLSHLSMNFILESVKIYKAYAEKHVNHYVAELDSGLR